MPKGLVIVVSAPSGAGKSTLCSELCRRLPFVRLSVSTTTRAPRPGEKEGKDYFFLGEKEFQARAAAGAFVEWAFVHGHHYGTPRQHLENELEAGHDVVLNIDVQGAERIRQIYPDGVFIFVAPSDFKALESRLKKRGQDSDEVIQQRLTAARKELQRIPRYDYVVINDNLEEAVGQLASVIVAEHQKVGRLGSLVESFQRLD